MTDEMKSTCGNCRHFHLYQEGQVNGACHRYPPTPIIVGMMQPTLAGQQPQPVTSGFWAPTSEGQICGEHAPGNALTKAPIATADEVQAALGQVKAEGTA